MGVKHASNRFYPRSQPSTVPAPAIEFEAAVQAADILLTSTDLAADPTDLVVPLTVGTWTLEARVYWQCGASSTDGYRSDYTFSGTQSSALRTVLVHNINTDTLLDVFRQVTLTSDLTVTGVSNQFMMVVEKITLIVTGAGDFRLRAAKESDVGADTLFKANGYLIARRAI